MKKIPRQHVPLGIEESHFPVVSSLEITDKRVGNKQNHKANYVNIDDITGKMVRSTKYLRHDSGFQRQALNEILTLRHGKADALKYATVEESLGREHSVCGGKIKLKENGRLGVLSKVTKRVQNAWSFF